MERKTVVSVVVVGAIILQLGALLAWFVATAPSSQFPPSSSRATLPPPPIGRNLTLSPTRPPNPDKYRVFLLFQQNIAMFQHSLSSAMSTFPNKVVVIDNSRTQDAAQHIQALQGTVGLYSTGLRLTFPALHNLLAIIAVQEGLEMYGWLHSDGVVIPKVEGNGDAVFEKAYEYVSSLSQPWAVLFTFWDIFAVYNPKAVVVAPWDEHILQNYPADCDAYGMWAFNGWKCTGLPGADDIMSVVHLGGPPNLKWDDMKHEERERLYRQVQKGDHNGQNWKNMSEIDAAGQRFAENAGRSYYGEKWGTGDCGTGGLVPKYIPHPIKVDAMKVSFIAKQLAKATFRKNVPATNQFM